MSFLDWNDDCSAEIAAAIAAYYSPTTSGYDPLNPYRRDPEIEQIPFQLSLELEWLGTWYEQRLYLDAKSPPRGKMRSGFEFSTLDYVVQDSFSPSCITFRGGAVKGQRVRVSIGNTRYFKGFVSNSVRVAYGQYSDLSDRNRYKVSCKNEMESFHTVPIFEIIRNTTEGGMIADLCSRYAPEFDVSGINLDFGDDIEEKIIGGMYLDQIIDEVLKNNPTGAFWMDISTDPKSTLYLNERNSPGLLLPVTITDQNLYGDGNVLYPGFCSPGDWALSPSEKTYRNSTLVVAPLLINTGRADVEQGSEVVLGTSNQAGWHNKVFPGMRFRVTGSSSTYTIKEQHNSPGIDDIRINAYQEADQTNAPYEIIGDEFETLAEDRNEIARRAAMRGLTGPTAGLVRVIIRLSTPLTEEEAERLAELSLRLNGWEGFFKTDNRKFPVVPFAGKILRHAAPAHDAVADVPIAELDWAVLPGYAPERNGESAAWVSYNLSFDNRELYTDNALLQMLLRERQVRYKDFDKLTIHTGVGEVYLIKDCVHASEGFPAINEITEYPDDITLTDISALATSGPWYPYPGAPYGPPIIAIDPDNPSTYWHAV